MKEKDCNIFEIWEEHGERIYRFILKNVKNTATAKDIHQDVLMKSYQFCAKDRTVTYLRSWLYKIAKNTLIDHLKKEGKWSSIDFDLVEEPPRHSKVGEASEYIRALLTRLPDTYAVPLRMHDLEYIDQKTIAERLNLSLPNVKSRIRRGRLKLKETFLECCDVTFDENGEMIDFAIKAEYADLQLEKQMEKVF